MKDANALPLALEEQGLCGRAGLGQHFDNKVELSREDSNTSMPASWGVVALAGGEESSKGDLCGDAANAGVASLDGSLDCDGEERPVLVGTGARAVRGRLWEAWRLARSLLWYEGEGDREGDMDRWRRDLHACGTQVAA